MSGVALDFWKIYFFIIMSQPFLWILLEYSLTLSIIFDIFTNPCEKELTGGKYWTFLFMVY